MSTTEISAAQAAERLGLTQQAIGQWAAKPGAPVRKAGTRVYVAWPAFARWREERLTAQAREEASGGDYEKERTRKMAAEATIAEYELAKLQGSMVTVEDSAKALGRILDLLMARLRAMPPRLGHLGHDAEEAIEAEIESLIEELHSFDEDVLEEPAGEAVAA